MPRISLRLSWSQRFTVQMLGPPENCWDVWASALWKCGGVSLGSLSSGNEGINPLKINGVCLPHFMERRAANKYFRSFSGYQGLTLLELTCLWVSLVKGSWFGFHMGFIELPQGSEVSRNAQMLPAGLMSISCDPAALLHVSGHAEHMEEAWCPRGAGLAPLILIQHLSPCCGEAPQHTID